MKISDYVHPAAQAIVLDKDAVGRLRKGIANGIGFSEMKEAA